MRTREASTISPDDILGRGLGYLPNEVKGHIAEALQCTQISNICINTVDGNPANQLRSVGYPIIYQVLFIPGGLFGISEPSTVA